MSSRPSSGPWRRRAFLVIGSVALAIGVVGIFVPLLPTTPLVILASACYLRGSERAHRWLLGHRWFGPVIAEWRETRSVPAAAKWIAVVQIAVSFTVTLLLLPASTYGRAGLVLLGAGLIGVVLSLPTAPGGRARGEVNRDDAS